MRPEAEQGRVVLSTSSLLPPTTQMGLVRAVLSGPSKIGKQGLTGIRAELVII